MTTDTADLIAEANAAQPDGPTTTAELDLIHRLATALEAAETAKTEKIAPVQGYSAGIPWAMHLRAYNVYCKKYGQQQALIDLEGRGCRGGFSTETLDEYIPGWRDELSELTKLRDRAEAAEGRAETWRKTASKLARETDEHAEAAEEEKLKLATSLGESALNELNLTDRAEAAEARERALRETLEASNKVRAIYYGLIQDGLNLCARARVISRAGEETTHPTPVTWAEDQYEKDLADWEKRAGNALQPEQENAMSDAELIAEAEARAKALEEALEPFAEFADHRGVVDADMTITQGSSMAKRQLTMGDCYAALRALAEPAPQGEQDDLNAIAKEVLNGPVEQEPITNPKGDRWGGSEQEKADD